MNEHSLDPRITPARKDVAAKYLEGRVEAKRFEEGETQRVVKATAGVHGKPEETSAMVSQLIFGEIFTVYDWGKEWAWGQCAHDEYVGYVPIAALAGPKPEASAIVRACATYIYPRPDLKSTPAMPLCLGARVAMSEHRKNDFVELQTGGWVFAEHLGAPGHAVRDYASLAEKLRGCPYLWGGRSAWGLDCSGLVQLVLGLSGTAAPRDTDMQATAIGESLGSDPESVALERGDLVFFPGHAGIMLDGECLLHANAWDMMVSVHPLSDVIAKISQDHDQPVTAIRRVTQD